MAIDAGNRGSSGKRRVEVEGCSMETLARKGRNGQASQALDHDLLLQDEREPPLPGSQTASSNTL